MRIIPVVDVEGVEGAEMKNHLQVEDVIEEFATVVLEILHLTPLALAVSVQ